MKTASRRPAAFAGIAIALVIGIAAFQGYLHFTAFPAQVSSTAGMIITEAGVVPETIEVKAGAAISILNQSSIPHILTSDSLRMADGNLLLTAPIYPGTTAEIRIPASTYSGDHRFVSKTSDGVVGTIVVRGSPFGSTESFFPSESDDDGVIPPEPGASEPAPSFDQFTTVAASSVSSAGNLITATTFAAPSSSAATSVMAYATPPIGTAITQNIPENKYTVGNPLHSGAPLDAMSYDSPPLFSGTASRPVSEPATGPELWIVGMLSVAMLLFVVRKQLS